MAKTAKMFILSPKATEDITRKSRALFEHMGNMCPHLLLTAGIIEEDDGYGVVAEFSADYEANENGDIREAILTFFFDMHEQLAYIGNQEDYCRTTGLSPKMLEKEGIEAFKCMRSLLVALQGYGLSISKIYISNDYSFTEIYKTGRGYDDILFCINTESESIMDYKEKYSPEKNFIKIKNRA